MDIYIHTYIHTVHTYVRTLKVNKHVGEDSSFFSHFDPSSGGRGRGE